MNIAHYTDPIESLLDPLRRCVSEGMPPSQSHVARVRKAVDKLHNDAIRDINIRSSRDARYRGFLRDRERIALLERLAAFMNEVDRELDLCDNPS